MRISVMGCLLGLCRYLRVYVLGPTHVTLAGVYLWVSVIGLWLLVYLFRYCTGGVQSGFFVRAALYES